MFCSTTHCLLFCCQDPVYAWKYGGCWRGFDHCNEVKKLDITGFLESAGRTKRAVRSGINVHSLIAFGWDYHLRCLDLVMEILVYQNRIVCSGINTSALIMRKNAINRAITGEKLWNMVGYELGSYTCVSCPRSMWWDWGRKTSYSRAEIPVIRICSVLVVNVMRLRMRSIILSGKNTGTLIARWVWSHLYETCHRDTWRQKSKGIDGGCVDHSKRCLPIVGHTDKNDCEQQSATGARAIE